MIVEGAIAVKTAIKSKYRRVEKIYIDIDKHNSDVAYIVQEAYTDRIPVERCSQEAIRQLASGKTHGGILAIVEPRRFQAVTSLLTQELPFLALIEGVEDSYNLGYIFRSLYAFGCAGVILPKREWNFEDNIMLKSSAGASEYLPIHLSEDLAETCEILHQNSFRIVSAYRGAKSKNIYRADFGKQPLLVCIGGPLRGLSKEVLDNSDEFVYIPYANDFKNSLNASSAAVVVASEVFRRKHEGD